MRTPEIRLRSTIAEADRVQPLAARLDRLEEELVGLAERHLQATAKLWTRIKALKADIKTLTTR